MKLSVVFLVQHSCCWANPRASTTSLAKTALPEGKLLPLPAAFICCPLWINSGMMPKVGPQRRVEREGPESTSQHLCLSYQQRWGVSVHLTLPGICGIRSESWQSPPCPSGKAGVPLSPGLSGGMGKSRITGNAMGQMGEEHLCRS